MPRFLLPAAVAALALFPSALSAAPVTRAQALEAVRTFEANASGSVAGTGQPADMSAVVAAAANTILKFTLESDDVLVDLGTHSVPWCDVKKGLADLPHSGERGLLLAAYLSGCVKAQLQSGKPDPNPMEGWVAMLKVYRTIRTREGVQIPEVEGLLYRQMNGSLEAYAAAELARAQEELKKTYGGSQSAAPKQDAPGLAAQP